MEEAKEKEKEKTKTKTVFSLFQCLNSSSMIIPLLEHNNILLLDEKLNSPPLELLVHR